MVIHCQVITSQVMAHRPDRDCPVIGRPVPRAAAADCQWQRKVILTTLSVKRRYFGGVTARAGRKPARAGHEPAVRRRQAPRRGGRRACPGPASGRMPRAGMQQGDHFGPAGPRPSPRYGNWDPGPPRGILIGLAVRFTGWSADPVPMQWRAIPCRPLIVGWRDYASVLPDCRPGLAGRSARPGSRAALGGPAGLLRPLAGFAAQATPSVRRSRPRRLFSCPARPPAAGGTTNGYLSRPQRCSASIRLIT